MVNGTGRSSQRWLALFGRPYFLWKYFAYFCMSSLISGENSASVRIFIKKKDRGDVRIRFTAYVPRVFFPCIVLTQINHATSANSYGTWLRKDHCMYNLWAHTEFYGRSASWNAAVIMRENLLQREGSKKLR